MVGISDRYGWVLDVLAVQPDDQVLEIGCGAGIFAFNVSVFWGKPEQALAIIRQLLLPGGQLYIFHQPPFEGKVLPIAEATQRLLLQYGYRVVDTRYTAMEPASVSCIIARPV